MAHTVSWSPAAQADIADIAAYLDIKVSKRTASHVVKAIRAAPYKVNNFPGASRRTPEFERVDYRETFAMSYRVLFRIEMTSIIITRVIHGQRPLATVPGSFEEAEQEVYVSQ
jgi:plasmid stabilization system protein ParE